MIATETRSTTYKGHDITLRAQPSGAEAEIRKGRRHRLTVRGAYGDLVASRALEAVLANHNGRQWDRIGRPDDKGRQVLNLADAS